jgi:adenylosuccinate lyase
MCYLEAAVLHELREYVHFCCTSEDINNLAYSLMMKEAKERVLTRSWDDVVGRLSHMSEEYAGIAMLSRTHG